MNEKIIITSEALHSDVTLKVVLPGNGLPQKLLILLHGHIHPEGAFSLIEDLPQELALEDLCDDYHMMVVIPYMKNRYYISAEGYDCDDFVARELLGIIRKKYPLPENAEVILGGISMGGYGAALIGAHTGVFHKIISISGAYISNDVLIGNPEVWGDCLPTKESAKGTYLYYFLPLEGLAESTERNVLAALTMLEGNHAAPVFAVTCGTKDWLYPRNLDLVSRLERLNISCEFLPVAEGDHDVECFREGLWKAVRKIEGNVQLG